MYSHSQYSYYQGSGATRGAGHNSATRHSHHAMNTGTYGYNNSTSTSTSVQQGEVTWDGSRWSSQGPIRATEPAAARPAPAPVPPVVAESTATNVRVPPPSTPLPPTPRPLSEPNLSSMSVEELVAHFSAVYHNYSQQVQEHKNTLSASNVMTDVQKTKESLQWAEYYADLSARAAHYYNNLPEESKVNSNSGPYNNDNSDHSKAYNRASSSMEKPQGTAASQQQPEPEVPESFRRFAHKNMSNCSSETQRRGMQELLEMTIRRAIQEGVMQSKDWNQEPFLPVPGSDNHYNANPRESVGSSSTTSRSQSSSSYSRQKSSSSYTTFSSPSSPSFRPNSSNNFPSDADSNNNSSSGNQFPDDPVDSKKKNALDEQKSTLDDWYGGNENGSASITFQPKVQVGKKKRRKQRRNRTITEEGPKYSSAQLNESTYNNNMKDSNERTFVLNPNPKNSAEEMQPSEQFQHRHKEPQQQENVFVLDPHPQNHNSVDEKRDEHMHGETRQAYDGEKAPKEEICPKKKAHLEQQKATLSDWYGGDESAPASINFVPRPVSSKKKERKRKRLEQWKKKVNSQTSTNNYEPKKDNSSSNEDNNSASLIQFMPKNATTPKNGRNQLKEPREEIFVSEPPTKRVHTSSYNVQSEMKPKEESFVSQIVAEKTPTLSNNVQNEMKLKEESSMSEPSAKKAHTLFNKKVQNEVKPKEESFMSESAAEKTYSLPNSVQNEMKQPKEENFISLPKAKKKHIKVKKEYPIQEQKTTVARIGGVQKPKDMLAHRANRFAGQGGIKDANSTELHDEYVRNVERYMGKSVIGGKKVKYDERDYEKMTVKGKCQTLEKAYLRLTAPPQAKLVRPQHILQKHLTNLKRDWMSYCKQRRSNPSQVKTSTRDYTWFCSQFKALRQDLTVQRLINALTVDVYETHARIALQEADLNEFNQSQTQLIELYDKLSQGHNEKGKQQAGLANQNEFVAYRLIYHVFLTGNKKYEGGSSDILKIMLKLTPAQRNDPTIVHALNVRAAIAEENYHAFFHLHKTSPNLGAFLMEKMIPQVQALALKHILKAYRPSISVAFVLKDLGFGSEKTDTEDGKYWLKDCGCKLSDDGTVIMTKESIFNDNNTRGNNVSSLI